MLLPHTQQRVAYSKSQYFYGYLRQKILMISNINYKNTMKAYFYYRHKLLQTTLWVGYFIYFKITPVFF